MLIVARTLKRFLVEHWQRSLLIALLVFVVLNNLIWHLLGGSPLHWDDAVHLSASLKAHRILVTAGVPLSQLLHFTWDYPPFVFWSAIPFYFIFGEGSLAPTFAMSCFLIVLLLSTYGLGRRLFDENVGLLSAFLVSAFPIVIDFSRQFMLDLPLAAMTTLSLYLLVRSNEFRSTVWSLLLGIVIGCGLLTKWTFPFFLIYPFLFTGAAVFLEDTRRGSRLRNLALCVLIASAISLPWYIVHFVSFLISRSHVLVHSHRSIIESILYYVLALPEQTSWLLLSAVVVGIALYVRQHKLKHIVPILSIVGGYVLLTMVILKVPRFAIPLLPPLAVLACAGIVGWVFRHGHLHEKRVRYLIASCAFVIFQYSAITYVTRSSQIGRILSTPLLTVPIIPVQGAKKSSWQLAAILRTIARDSSSHGESRKSLRVVPDYIFFNWATFEYAAMLNRFPVTISTIIGFPGRSDFTILKTGELGEDVAKRQRITDTIIADTLGYEFLRSFPLPDGSSAILLRARVGTGQLGGRIQPKASVHS